MPDPNYKITAKPTLREIEAKLKKAHGRIKNLTGAHKKVSVLLDNWVQVNFRKEGAMVGGWPPFKSGRGRWIKRTGSSTGYWDSNAKLLQDTGRLKSSFDPFYNKNTAGIGSDLPYSKFHEKGEGHLPVRRMLPSNDDKPLLRKVLKVYELHIKEVINV